MVTAVDQDSGSPGILRSLLQASLLASLLLIASAPVALLSALLIFLESPGNPFYVQRRVGLLGVEFPMLKLRTMHAHADRADRLAVLHHLPHARRHVVARRDEPAGRARGDRQSRK